jgi:predicted ABC-type ATPase
LTITSAVAAAAATGGFAQHARKGGSAMPRRVEPIYLALPNVEMSRLRVAERVAHGGHAIPPQDIVRRFPRSLRNLLDVYAGVVDHTRCFLNSGPVPDAVFEQHAANRTILNQLVYDELVREACT